MLRLRFGSRLISGVLQALIAGATLAGPLASPAAAQTARSVRVVSRSAPIHAAPRPRSEILMTVLRCAVFEVMDKEANWYWIYLPRDTFGVRRPGWVSALDVEITTEEPCKDLPTELAEAAEQQADASGSAEPVEPSAEATPSRSLIKAQNELEQARREFEKASGVPSPGSSSAEPAAASTTKPSPSPSRARRSSASR